MRVDTPVNSIKQPVVEQIIQQETVTKKVSKIMVFYSDNTFDTFISEKNQERIACFGLYTIFMYLCIELD